MKYEFETHNVEGTLPRWAQSLRPQLPILTGGVGRKRRAQILQQGAHTAHSSRHGTSLRSHEPLVSRLIEELILKLTHSIQMDWILPGVPPTGRRVGLPHVVIVEFQNGKIAHEHIYWDRGSLLAQLSLLDSWDFPVVGVETAEKYWA